MNWKILLLFVGLAAFVSCGGGPKSDAEKLCDCGREMVKMMNDLAPESDLEAKSEECDKLGEEMEDKYKDDEAKMKEFEETFETCAEELDDEFDAAEDKWREAQEEK